MQQPLSLLICDVDHFKLYNDGPVCGRVTVSIGVACVTPQPHGPMDARTLIEEADRHLYLAKRLGRNQVSYQDEENTTQ